MGFIQTAFIRLNTHDIINNLEYLKYKNGWYHLLKCNMIGTIIDEEGKGFYYGIADNSDIKPNQIDCKDNINLFLAIAALKDNTDINQWVICQFDHTDPDNGCEYKTGDWRLSNRKKMKKYKRQEVWKKASLDEIIKHFT